MVVYIHRNRVTNEPFYVGAGSNRRAFEFTCRSIKWKEYVKTHGFPFVELYKTGLNAIEALYLESYLINVFGRTAKEKKGYLVNEANDRQSASLYGVGESHSNYGRTTPNEVREKIGIGNKGKTVSVHAKKKMSATHRRLRLFAKKVIDNRTGIVYDSIGDAALARGLDMKVVSSWLRGKVKSKMNEFNYI